MVDKGEYLWQLNRLRHVLLNEWNGVYYEGPWDQGPLYWFEREGEIEQGVLEGEHKAGGEV